MSAPVRGKTPDDAEVELVTPVIAPLLALGAGVLLVGVNGSQLERGYVHVSADAGTSTSKAVITTPTVEAAKTTPRRSNGNV